ncbi:hypothetical protein PR003_g24392 [Phytophthora rubi]|uniref:Uncharacterized protein n=1 Tax=Phytophthora rubi TaxID=129364 RepID=A0A6A3IQL7_9STRA|nr:hypothetical protein PR002_g23451 [Phytophthora rubi]KAE8984391.1 hypothetical protein PR001_g23189 [Phytophthora rubi]KAE9293900.1 hypothetical protein PR003_g24392 [Phytophthora rubi]
MSSVGWHIPQPASRAAEPLLPPVDKLFPRPNLELRMKMHMVRVVNETPNALIKDTLLQDEPGRVLWCPASRTRSTPGSIQAPCGTRARQELPRVCAPERGRAREH